MTDAVYILSSLVWAIYGLVFGFCAGCIARLMWTIFDRK